MEKKNHIFSRPHKKPILWDAFYTPSNSQKPLVIFCHGYKGFKDWGAWDLAACAFDRAGFFFVKFNFSHNGGTMDQPLDFPDLEAFGNNNYSRELDDLEDMITYLHSMDNPYFNEIDPNVLFLIGHSRGGGTVVIKASEDERVTKVATWAGVSDFGQRTATIGDLEEWRQKGVKYVTNTRTKQEMPHFYQFYEDYEQNKNRLNIKRATRTLKIPQLIVHAVDDPSVKFNEAQNLHLWNPSSELVAIERSNHVFGAAHPWIEKKMPKALEQAVDATINFFKH